MIKENNKYKIKIIINKIKLTLIRNNRKKNILKKKIENPGRPRSKKKDKLL